jgi:hypothetical protein
MANFLKFLFATLKALIRDLYLPTCCPVKRRTVKLPAEWKSAIDYKTGHVFYYELEKPPHEEVQRSDGLPSDTEGRNKINVCSSYTDLSLSLEIGPTPRGQRKETSSEEGKSLDSSRHSDKNETNETGTTPQGTWDEPPFEEEVQRPDGPAPDTEKSKFRQTLKNLNHKWSPNYFDEGNYEVFKVDVGSEASVIREMIRQEDTLTYTRMSWFATLQGLLWATLGLLVDEQKGFPDLRRKLLKVVCFLGIVTSLRTMQSIAAARVAIRRLSFGRDHQGVLGLFYSSSDTPDMCSSVPTAFLIAWIIAVSEISSTNFE